MVRRPFLAIALAVLMLGGLAGPAWCQATKAAAARALDRDPAPSTAPDPLTPPEVNTPPPAAPGVPTTPTEAAKPASEIDPIVALVRQRLAAAPRGGNTGDREDRAGLAAFYGQHTGEAVWTSKDGFTARAAQALGEIRKADDWGLKASAFDLPSLPQGPATTEALAEAEIKLGLAVLKYGRHARGGGWTRCRSIAFDQKPTIYDPKTLMLAVAASNAVDAYLRELHPRHRNSSACARRCWPRAPPSPRTHRPALRNRPRISSA
jgi:hypothetical protein